MKRLSQSRKTTAVYSFRYSDAIGVVELIESASKDPVGGHAA